MTKNIKTELSREDLRQAQKIMLYIMKRIHAVCVEHNIKYWLDYGTLLGAIRHDGFIPWDDDMDICMMREDYEKFCQIAPTALGEEFFWQTKDTDPAFFPEYGKVRLNGTLWEENILSRSPIAHKGLFVDIFPLDPFPENAKMIRYLDRKSKLYSAVLNYKIHKIVSPKPVNAMIQRIVSAFTSGKRLKKWFADTVQYLQQFKTISPLISKLCLDTERDICQRCSLEKVILKKFEDTEFYVPEKYDERLKKLFRDYMQLPPEDKRYGHHAVVKFDFGKYENL